MIVFTFFAAGYSSVQTILRWFSLLFPQESSDFLNGLSHPQNSIDVYLRDSFLSNVVMTYKVSQDPWGGVYAEHPLV